MSIVVSDLSFGYPGDDDLFFEVSFRVPPGEHWGLVGENGSGKSTLLRVLAGHLRAGTGDVRLGGDTLYLPQDIGFATDRTIREVLLGFAPPALRAAGERLAAAERRLAEGDPEAGMAVGEAIGEWSELQGYALEGRWDASARRILGVGWEEAADRPVTTLSGGELKRLALDVLFASEAAVLLVDEPDNYLDVPAKAWLEDLVRQSSKTVLTISHDRQFLGNALQKIVTLEGSGAWVHGGSYRTYPEERERRQRLLGDAVERWHAEERRLYRHMKVMKQRASLNDGNAKAANAAETRWERFRDAGPPPPPATTRPMRARLVGGDAARRAVTVKEAAYDGLFLPFADEVHHGERLGLIGANGTGKTHLLRVLAGLIPASEGGVVLGSRVVPGLFTQVNDRPDFLGRTAGEIIEPAAGNHEATMKHLARYGLERTARQRYETLSGGQKARLEILSLELAGQNLLLLDEPTDNLDIESAEALESALDGFEGTVISVSHDRTFLQAQDRFWLLDTDGVMTELPDWPAAHHALLTGELPKTARTLTTL
ncbi:MAG TPA: ABC-F family ATP-binding cassette domain-containing protein [Acidimicrobiales bacterium]|nr:ABC-F family ATP-binding cassette domain-containing protein [Acidimicrobiales bacterium]